LEITYEKQFQNLCSTLLVFPKYSFNGFLHILGFRSCNHRQTP
jgi:hypothetical protein